MGANCLHCRTVLVLFTCISAFCMACICLMVLVHAVDVCVWAVLLNVCAGIGRGWWFMWLLSCADWAWMHWTLVYKQSKGGTDLQCFLQCLLSCIDDIVLLLLHNFPHEINCLLTECVSNYFLNCLIQFMCYYSL